MPFDREEYLDAQDELSDACHEYVIAEAESFLFGILVREKKLQLPPDVISQRGRDLTTRLVRAATNIQEANNRLAALDPEPSAELAVKSE